MSYLDIRTVTTSLERGNVSTILGVLHGIHEQVSRDEIMEGVTETIGDAIRQLRELQQLAYDTMMEIEAERAAGLYHWSGTHKKPH